MKNTQILIFTLVASIVCSCKSEPIEPFQLSVTDYNYSQINETWKFRSGEPDGDYVGLLENKKMFILSSRGDTGYGENEKNEHMNFQTTYLKFVFGIMGIKDISIISLDNEEFGGEIFEKSKKKIYQRIEQI